MAVLVAAPSVHAATYQVGPGKAYSSLKSVASKLAPGDVVLVDGDAVYAGDVKLTKWGAPDKKITVKGVRVNGKRPVLSGGTNTIEVFANHYVIEGFDIKGGSSRCFYHHGHDVTLRDSVVHDCPNNGVQGANTDSGSLTLDYVEIYACGYGTQKHPIYMDTDQSAYPGSVFRMQHCFLHDGNGGNMVKSRSERNEIHYNWIEGAYYRELELIGGSAGPPREDSDVVGNVIRNTSGHYVVRVGGDGTADTNGRYRFVNNTFLVKSAGKAVFQAFDGVQSVEMHNNAFYRPGGGGVNVFTDVDADWTSGKAVIAGKSNWLPSGSTNVPAQWSGTIYGANPGFQSLASYDLEPASGSPLRDKGAAAPASPNGYAFPSPLVTPASLPPPRMLEAVGSALPRVISGPIDIGALEYAAVAGAIGEAAAALEEEDGGDAQAAACAIGSRNGAGGGAALGIAMAAVGMAARRRARRR